MLAAGVLKSATLRGPAQSHAGPATARGSRTDHKPASRCQAHTQSGLVSPETAHVLRCDRGPLCGTCDTVDPVQGLQHPWDSGFPLGARKRVRHERRTSAWSKYGPWQGRHSSTP